MPKVRTNRVKYPELDYDSASPPKQAWRRRLNGHANILKKCSITIKEAIKMDTQGGMAREGNFGPEADEVDEAWQPLSRKLPIASSKINPYRMVIVIRLFVLGIFLRYRLMNPVHDAIGLWLTSFICEIWDLEMSADHNVQRALFGGAISSL